MVAELGEVVWVVDFNRQSLDGVLPNRPRSGRGVGSHRESETRLSTTGPFDYTTGPKRWRFLPRRLRRSYHVGHHIQGALRHVPAHRHRRPIRPLLQQRRLALTALSLPAT